MSFRQLNFALTRLMRRSATGLATQDRRGTEGLSRFTSQGYSQLGSQLACACVLLAMLGGQSVNATTAASIDKQDPLQAAVSSEFRDPSNKQRDRYRHPYQTLAFFGVKPSDTVIELWPGKGWYAEILAPYLNEKGQYIAGIYSTDVKDPAKKNSYRVTSAKQFKAWVANNSAQVSHAKTVTFEPPSYYRLGKDNSVDRVLTFRNLHNWAMQDDLAAVFKSVYKVLKPGGTFGVVEHRAAEGMPVTTGYMEQDKVIALAKKVGFTLVATSEVNANPKDSKDHPSGVWSLPPRLKDGDKNKAHNLAIGESDRMTLKFIKPKKPQS